MQFVKKWIEMQHPWSIELVITVLIFIGIAFCICQRISSLWKWERKKFFVMWALIDYMIAVFVATIFSRSKLPKYSYELEFLWTYRRGIAYQRGIVICDIVFNVLMLLPVGLCLPMLIGAKNKKRLWVGCITVCVGFGISFMIEMLQLVLRRGFFEFDDIFHNTLGVLIGFFLYCGIVKMKENLHYKESAHAEKSNDK